MSETNNENECIIYNTISALRKTDVQAAGLTVLHAIAHTRLTTQFGRTSTSNETPEASDEDGEECDQFDDDLDYLRSLDPKDWKNQDHYAVLGIKKIRHEATEDLIKRAYKQKILKHHPDKRKATGEEVRDDDDYFTCITRAWETLGNPAKRRSYDSVDPCFSDDIPDEKEAKSKFYETMDKAFQLNARWSVKKPVPTLGDENTPRSKVERFYSFWYDFESWRDYAYLDEEDKDSGSDRDTRRWIERNNKTARAKRKKEEMSRIRLLVDTAYNADPRIKKFQQEDKDKKTAAKRARQEAAKARQLEEERLAKEVADREREEREKRELEEKTRLDTLKQEREAMKKALKKERKALRDLCKAQEYFSTSPTENIKHMESVQRLCELFKLHQLEDTIKSLQSGGREAFLAIVAEAENKIEEERRAGVNKTPDSRNNVLEKSTKTQTAPWAECELQLLIKAVNLFPAGTNQRWEVVANFINQHATDNSVTRNAKDVLAKAKDLQSTDFSKSSMKEQANKKAFDNFIAEKKSKEAIDERMPAVTERLDPPVVVTNGTSTTEVKVLEPQNAAQPWTPAEQKLLEQALKTYSDITGPERWDRIASCIPSRTKKECMRRYKELVELIKAKKAAQAAK